MRRLSLTDTARDGLGEILVFIATRTGDARDALTIVDALLAQCERLAALPGTLGRARPEFAEGLRSFPYRGYVIFFRYSDDKLEVVHIVSARRDIGSIFEGD